MFRVILGVPDSFLNHPVLPQPESCLRPFLALPLASEHTGQPEGRPAFSCGPCRSWVSALHGGLRHQRACASGRYLSIAFSDRACHPRGFRAVRFLVGLAIVATKRPGSGTGFLLIFRAVCLFWFTCFCPGDFATDLLTVSDFCSVGQKGPSRALSSPPAGAASRQEDSWHP